MQHLFTDQGKIFWIKNRGQEKTVLKNDIKIKKARIFLEISKTKRINLSLKIITWKDKKNLGT